MQMLAAWMQGINGTAEVIPTTKSDVDLDRIIGRNAFSLEKVLDMEPDFLKVPSDNTAYPLTSTCSLTAWMLSMSWQAGTTFWLQ